MFYEGKGTLWCKVVEGNKEGGEFSKVIYLFMVCKRRRNFLKGFTFECFFLIVVCYSYLKGCLGGSMGAYQCEGH